MIAHHDTANHMVGAMAITITETLMMVGAALTPEDDESPDSYAWATETLTYAVATFLCRTHPGMSIADHVDALDALAGSIERKLEVFHQRAQEDHHGNVV